jgi:hypothetical protein
VKQFWNNAFIIARNVFAVIGVVFTFVYIGMQFGLFDVRGSIATRNASLGITPEVTLLPSCPKGAMQCNWSDTVEWGVLRSAFQKDAPTIDRVSKATGVTARMIVAAAAPEQLRFFTDNRESFKKYFEPLKILSSLSKFSLGVSGIKQETAIRIEQYANDPTSDFYPGPGMSALIAYQPSDNHDQVLYDRLTDAHDHYYSYLYTALFIKEIESQWSRAGFDISDSAGTITTLFNIGFDESKPNATPQVAGAIITLGGTDYTFGQLGALFYESNELTTAFPKQ